MDKKIPAKEETLSVVADPLKMVSKMATKITVAKTNSNNYIITFLSELPGESPLLIERIAIDEKLVESFINTLNQVKERKND